VEVEDGRTHHAQVKPTSDQVNQAVAVVVIIYIVSC
jgi:hypothetical protein